LRDIPILLEDRFTFFDSLFANLVDAQMQYFQDASRILNEMGPSLQAAPRTSNQKWVITDEAVSSFNRNAYAAGGPPMAGAPISQPPPSAYGGGSAAYGSTSPASSVSPSPYSAPAAQPSPYGRAPAAGYGSAAYGGAVAGGAAAGGAAAGGAAAYGAMPQRLPPTPQAAGVRAKALYPFQGQDATELTFQFNDVITVTRQGGEWWEGEINGRRGLFPANYVQIL